jgi:threonine dehydratase
MSCQITLEELKKTADLVYQTLSPTPQYAWPLLQARFGTRLWVKHENHLPVGSFKVRGGLNYIHHLVQENPLLEGVVAATRGNHGQSIALAAAKYDLAAKIVVPFGNSNEKNLAMRALGADLIEYGKDFQEAVEYAQYLADQLHYHYIPSFHKNILLGVATYAYEFFTHCPDLDVVYVPIGQGSGICAMALVRDLMGLKTEIVGVVSEKAPAYADSFSQGELVCHDVEWTLADGLACRKPNSLAFEMIQKKVSRIVKVCEPSIKEAMRILFSDTHNVAEGSAAAGLAAFMKEKNTYLNCKVGIVLSGGNVDSDVFAQVLLEKPQKVAEAPTKAVWI